MYFDGVKLFELDKNINNLNHLYAHKDRNNDNRREKLQCHIILTYKYFEFICRQKNLDNIFHNLENSIFKDKNKFMVSLYKEMFANAIYMHDVGKINPNFQHDKMKNEFYKENPSGESKHSLLGSCIYISYFSKKIKESGFEKADKRLLRFFMYINAYVISKHHGFLLDFESYAETLRDETEKFVKDKYFPDLNIDILSSSQMYNSISRSLKYIEECFCGRENFDVYIYSKLLFSLLTAADYYATSEFMDGEKVTDLGIIDEELKKKFDCDVNKYKIIKSVRNYEKFPVLDGNYKDINQLRCEITIESEKNYIKNKDKNIYYLEAPTGAGKTVTSINLARLILNSNKNINKLFYIFPFNTLVEQTYDKLIEVFENDKIIKENISVINSITPIKIVDKDENGYENIDYKMSLLNRIFLNYPFVITTHVSLFNFLFGTSREEVFPLYNLCNSVIILDEIQSYKNGIWKEIINFLNSYAELLNMKIIIMSATLPRLNELVEADSENFSYLISDRNHYFKNPLFKDRVKFEMLDLGKGILEEQFKILLNDIISESKSNNKILVEFIFKKTADEFFEYANKNFPKNNGHKIEIITSDDNRIDRDNIINFAKKDNSKLILIATQVIEAGVDIDMDLGYKNISILDAEEQFMGRVNRSCLKKGKVKFFIINNCRILYKEDVRKEKELTLVNVDIQKILKEKAFDKYYKKVIDEIEIRKHEKNDNGYSNFIKMLNNFKFDDIKKRMKLIDEEIDQRKYTIFLSRPVQLEKGRILYGDKVWKDYKNLLMDNKMDYAEKKVKISNMNEEISYFIYKVKKIPSEYADLLGDIYYISDGEKYIVNGRFNQEIFICEKPDEANLFL